MKLRARLALLLSSAVLAASLIAVVPAAADDAPPPSATPGPDTSAPAIPSDPQAALQTIEVDAGGFHPSIQLGTGNAQLRADPDASSIITPGVTFTYQWKRNGVSVSKATKSVFTLASTDKLKQLSVVVTAHKAGYAALVGPVAAFPFHIVVVDGDTGGVIPIYGDGRVGREVYVGPGWHWGFESSGTGVNPAITKYQWYRAATATSALTAIPGATHSTYTQVAADLNRYLVVRLTIAGPGIVPGTTALSGRAGPTQLGVNDSDGVASAAVDAAKNTIFASLGPNSLVPATPVPKLTYQWYRTKDGTDTAIPGGTASSHKLTISDFGRLVWVRITVHRAGFAPADAVYALDSPKTSYDLHQSGTTSLTSSPHYGTPVTATLPVFVDNNNNPPVTTPTYRYTWFRLTTPDLLGGGPIVVIPGATKQTYTPGAADIGKYLAVSAAPTYPGYLALGPGTPVSGQVQALEMGVSGTPTVQRVSPTSLTLKVSLAGFSWAVKPTKFSYTWWRYNPGPGTLTPISGAHASTYTLTSADAGKYVYVQVTSSRTGYRTVSASSGIVDYSVSLPSPSIEGSSNFGDTLQAVPGTSSPAMTVNYAYQWYRETQSGHVSKISGATKSTFKTSTHDIGYNIYVVIKPIKSGWLSIPATTASIPIA